MASNYLERLKKFLPPLNYEYAVKRITQFIKEEVEKTGVKGVVIGLSGGVDSSVTAFLAVMALGSDRVVGLIMPDERTTPKEDIDDALRVAKILNIEYYFIPITEIYDAFARRLPIYDDSSKVANGNMRARIRMVCLYYFANKLNLLVCGTSDKSEIFLGYYTKYGDGGVDILPIGDLYKTQVRKLGKYIGIPERIVTKPSSPRLWPGQLAESELGITYEEVDVILYHYVDLGMPPEEIVQKIGIDMDKIKMVIRRVHRSEHKRMLPPIPKITSVTIGLDWKMPRDIRV